MLPIDHEADPPLVRVGWLLEELRVGLFAQELRTAERVSVKRIVKALAESRTGDDGRGLTCAAAGEKSGPQSGGAAGIRLARATTHLPGLPRRREIT